MADTTAPNLPAVDDSPISPIERRNSLEKHLQMRPDAKDLKERHILLDTTAAPYVLLPSVDFFCWALAGVVQPIEERKERELGEMARYAGPRERRRGRGWGVGKERGSAEEIIERREIMRLTDIGVPSALQSAAQDLERQRATDNLRKGLEKRPEKEELVERMFLLPPLPIPLPLFLYPLALSPFPQLFSHCRSRLADDD